MPGRRRRPADFEQCVTDGTHRGFKFFWEGTIDLHYATKKKDCHFRNKYYRLKSRRGSQRAIVAVDHAMLKCVYVVLSQRKPYEEPKPVSLTEAQKQRKASSL